jgi:type IV pilus secretin PilQ/predicted competence protein
MGCAQTPRARPISIDDELGFQEPSQAPATRSNLEESRTPPPAQPLSGEIVATFIDDQGAEPAQAADSNPFESDNPAPTAEEAALDNESNPAVSSSAEDITVGGDDANLAVSPAADGVTEVEDQGSSVMSPSAAGATDAAGTGTPSKPPRPTWPLYPSPPAPSDDGATVVSKVMQNGATLVTLHMDDLDVRKALELLSRQAGVNILVSPGVNGSVTVDLRNVTLDEALQAIVKICNLTSRREGELIYVSTADEVNQGINTSSGGLGCRVYRLNYARGVDLLPMIKPILTIKGRVSTTPAPEIGIKSDTTKAGGNSLASDDVLVVQDYEWVLKNADLVVAKMDVQPSQVLIEAVIVSVTLNKNCQLGVNYALLGAGARELVVAGSGAAINSAAGFSPATLLTAGGLLQGDTNVGTAADVQGLKFGFVAKDVTGFVNALALVGSTKILATPRLLVLNKQRAEIQLGDRLGFQTLTQTQTSTIQQVQFMNVGTQLRLRPFITSDGMVRMEIHPERSSGEVVNNVPSTHTTEVTTNVMVPDGATIVIGGLIDDEKDTVIQGIPGLMNLPVVGPLFRLTTTTNTKKELVVLLTPRIWKGDSVSPECLPIPPSSLPPLPPITGPAVVSEAKARTAKRMR